MAFKNKVFVLFLGSALVITIIALYLLIVKGDDHTTIQRSFILSYSNPLVIVEAISLFMVFHYINFNNKYVNYIASSIFAVYLLHMHPNIKEWYYSYCGQLYNHSFLHHLFVLICLFLGIILISVFFDKIRLFLFSWLYSKCEISISKKWITKE